MAKKTGKTGRSRPRIWEGRGDHLEGMRYTILPADVAGDLDLGVLHLRFLAHIGRQNAKRGWCRISQAELAEKWNCSRSRLNQAIKVLVKKGYVRELPSQETHECWCAYQIVIASDEQVFRGGNTTPHKAEGSVPRGEQESSAEGTGVFHPGNTYTDHTDHTDPNRDGAQARSAIVDASFALEGEIVTDEPVKPQRKQRREPLADDWTPGEAGLAFAREKSLTDQQIAEAFEKFRAHHQAKGSVMADWPAAWRTWVLNEIKFVRAAPPPGRRSGRFSVTDYMSN